MRIRGVSVVRLLSAVGVLVALGASGVPARAAAIPVSPGEAVIAVAGPGGPLLVSEYGGPFRNLGGDLRGAPAVLHQDSRLLYVARGTDDKIHVRTDTTPWTPFDPGLTCASPPAVSGSDENRTLMIACIGTDRHAYAVASTIPSTTNPVAGRTTRFGQADLNDDSTPVRGGIGPAVDDERFIVTGPSYPSEQGQPGGNTYELDPWYPSEAVQMDVTCADAPTDVPTAYDDFVACHAPTSAHTYGYLLDYEKTGAGRVTRVDLGGSTAGSPAEGETPDGGTADIVVTGTNGCVYSTVLSHTALHTGWALLPAHCLARSSPGAIDW